MLRPSHRWQRDQALRRPKDKRRDSCSIAKRLLASRLVPKPSANQFIGTRFAIERDGLISYVNNDIVSKQRQGVISIPQIIVRRLSDEVHRALKARAHEHGRSTEAEARDIIARAVFPDARPKAGDLLCGIWQGADVSEVTLERDKTPHEPMSFE